MAEKHPDKQDRPSYFVDKRDGAGHAVDTEKSLRRKENYRNIHAAVKKLAAVSERVLGEPASMVMSPEIEFAAVINSSRPEDFPLEGKGPLKTVEEFHFLPVIDAVDLDESSANAFHGELGAEGLTHDGRHARQMEVKLKHKLPSGRVIGAVEMARILEELTQTIRDRAGEFGIAAIDYRSVPFRSPGDQASSCQWNLNLSSASGKNLFDDGRGYESPLMILFVDEYLKFEKEGGLLISVPSPEAFQRIARKGMLEPKEHRVDERKKMGEWSTFMLRGPNRDVGRKEDSRAHKHADAGGVRVEKRSAAPGSITDVPEESPSLSIEAILAVATRTLERYAEMSVVQKAELTPQYLWAMKPEPLPETYNQVYDQFEQSQYIREFYPSVYEHALRVVAKKTENAAVGSNTRVAAGRA